MIKYFCDKCGAETDSDLGIAVINKDLSIKRKLLLCDSCFDKADKFFNLRLEEL